MEQYQEFIGNHPFLIAAFMITLGMVMFFEVQRRMRGTREVSPAQATRLQNDDGVFVDIRDVGEYRQGHLVGARNIPLKELGENVKQLKKYKSKPVIVYCANGGRSAKATTLLAKDGFEQVYSIAGGLPAWEKANLPVERK